MIHYTLNTGHSRTSPRDEVAADVIARMAQFVQVGEHNLGGFHQSFAGYRIVVPESPGGLIATLCKGQAPILTLGAATTADEAAIVWPALESLYFQVTESPVMRVADFAASRQPASLPWLAVALNSPHLCPSWAGDFERCLAWAWINQKKGS